MFDLPFKDRSNFSEGGQETWKEVVMVGGVEFSLNVCQETVEMLTEQQLDDRGVVIITKIEGQTSAKPGNLHTREKTYAQE